MTAVVKHSGVQLPAAFAPFVGKTTNNELTQGVQSGFPIISFRGKVWRVRKSGHEENYVNDEGEAVQSVDLVLIRSNPQPSKTYYDKAFEEGSTEPPRCWSADGMRPDASVPEPVSKVCASCPKNVWGSKITPSGAKSRECSDVRRMAVAFAHEIEDKGKDATLFLLRVPPASLNPLKDYAEKTLEPRGLQYFMLVTKVGFDPQMSHPKLTFKPKRLASDEEAEAIVALRESEDARRILAEATEFEAAGTTAEGGEPTPQEEVVVPAATPAASSPSRKPKSRPADEEDFETAPKPKAKAAAPVVEEEEDDEVVPEPAPAPKPKKAKAAAPPVDDKAAADEEEDFESMLDTILKPVGKKQ